MTQFDEGWSRHVERIKNEPPRPWLLEALPFVKNKGEVLELGPGGFVDAKHLLAEGFGHITAVDMQPHAQEIYETLPRDRVDYVISKFEDYSFPPETYDLINAQFSIFFVPKAKFTDLWQKTVRSLKVGGIFVGQMLGPNDSWNGRVDGISFLKREEVEELLAGLKVHLLREEEVDLTLAGGAPKHWHRYHIIVERV